MIRHESRLLLFAYAGGAPAVVVSIALLVTSEWSAKVVWTAGAIVLAAWLVVPLALRERTVGPLRTLASVLEAFREGDYSVRSRDRGDPGALGAAARELNALGDTLREHRLGALEASALLERVVGAIDVAVFAVDDAGVVKLSNAAADKLAGRGCQGLTVDSAGIAELLEGPSPRVLTRASPLELRRSSFRQSGRAHTLLVLSDVSRVLREKERDAWQRIVRVLGHEINSSLAPIQSLGQSLSALVVRDPLPSDWREDLTSGLGVIERRAGALSRFLTAYARLAKLPPPSLAPVDVGALVERAARLEQRATVTVKAGPPAQLMADADQIEQALINLVKNAAEAAPGAKVEVTWAVQGPDVAIVIDDEGPGVGDTANLFVPFFTTKPEGSGIGLVLARQIAEAHAGAVTLESNPRGNGARATLRLPNTTG